MVMIETEQKTILKDGMNVWWFNCPCFQKQMDAESRVSTFERLNKDLNRQIAEIQENLENETRDKSTMMAKMRWTAHGLVTFYAMIL